jgi:2-iminoacetate synthase ThiH
MTFYDLKEGKHFYIEEEKVVFTHQYHIQRGYCCGNGCKNCAFIPKNKKGNTIINKKFNT